jgi:hypothetical protein
VSLVVRRPMTVSARHKVWFILSDLFVDTEWSIEDLRRMGISLKGTGFSASEIEAILRTEVAPVCFWGLIGPWPDVDQDWLIESIEKYLRRPSLFRRKTWGFPSAREKWKVVRYAMEP